MISETDLKHFFQGDSAGERLGVEPDGAHPPVPGDVLAGLPPLLRQSLYLHLPQPKLPVSEHSLGLTLGLTEGQEGLLKF